MPINRTDIKLRQSERLDDTDYGGGQITNREVVSGELNNLFPDISRMDRTYGRVSMRKAYMQVETNDRSTYYGAHAAMTLDAKDPNVSVCFFSDGDFFSQRKAARSRMESYLTRGPQLTAALCNDHFTGTYTLSIHCPTVVDAPRIGDVLVLVANQGTAEEFQQYVRIAEMSEVIQNLATGDNSYFRKKIVTLTISTRLEHDFIGSDIFQGVSGYNSKLATCIYTTTVADAATYYGVKKLADDAVAGSLIVQVEDIQTPLLPCTTSTTNVTDVTLDGTTVEATSSGGTTANSEEQITKSIAYRVSPNGQFHVGTPVQRNSLNLRIGGMTLTDDGGGNIVGSGSAIGSIDYSTGIITFGSNVSSNSGSGTISYIPAVTATQAALSGSIAVLQGNRGFSYVYYCKPEPMPGTLKVHYLSGGKWYILQDDGRGALKGESEEIGAGTVNFATGSVSLALGAMPDVNSTILLTWAKESRVYDISGGESKIEYDLEFTFTLQDQGIARSTFVCHWGDGAFGVKDDGHTNIKVATKNSSGWSATGDIVGTINYATGKVSFKPGTQQQIPSCLENFTIMYDYGPVEEHIFTEPPRAAGGVLNLQLPRDKYPIQKNSFEIEWHTLLQQYGTETSTSNIAVGDKRTVQIGPVDPTHIYEDEETSDPNIGHFKGESTDFSLLTTSQTDTLNEAIAAGTDLEEAAHPTVDNNLLSTVNYETGIITLKPDRVGFFPVPQYEWRETGNSWTEDGTQQVQTLYGVAEMPARILVQEQEYSFSHMDYKLAPCVFPINGWVKVKFRKRGDSTTHREYQEPAPRSFCIRPTYNVSLVPGSVNLKAGDIHLVDNGNGKLYYNIDGTNGIGQECGIIDYATRVVTITVDNVLTTSGSTANLDIRKIKVIKAAASSGIMPVSYVVFRLPGAPIVLNSVKITAKSVPFEDASDGEDIVGSSNELGGISGISNSEYGGGMEGSVDYRTGFCQVYFGRWVNTSTFTSMNASERPLWFENAVRSADGSQVWQPCSIIANTLRYSCTVASYIALDSGILGIDTIRLPIDGKVPVFRKGDVVLIHDTKERALGNLGTSTEILMGEGNLGDIAIYDKNGRFFPEVTGGAYCPTNAEDKRNYTVDLLNGKITTSNTLDFNVYDLPSTGTTPSGNPIYVQYEPPFRARYRIEDMCLCVDTQITGHLGLNQPLTHNYSKNTALVSSVLPCKDLQAAAYNEFTQGSWDDVWSNDARGSITLGKYDFATYPIQVDNKGAIKERWLIRFTSAYNIDIIGETIGMVAQGLLLYTTGSGDPTKETNNGTGSTAGGTGGTSTGGTSSSGLDVESSLIGAAASRVTGQTQNGNGWYTAGGKFYLQAISRLTNRPYWCIAYDGFSTGWKAGDCIRFNTDAAGVPFWFVRTTLQHPAQEFTDKYQFLMRGDSI